MYIENNNMYFTKVLYHMPLCKGVIFTLTDLELESNTHYGIRENFN